MEPCRYLLRLHIYLTHSTLQLKWDYYLNMKAFSLFSGIGGFDLALERCGHEIVGHSEIDKYADQIYSKHFTNKNYGDITKINPHTLPDFELLVGGFPCQSFSIAGKRKGFKDTRGTLFFEIARIVREKQPRLLLLENVKGLLSHDKGNTFRTIIATLDDLGYNAQWQVLNSKDFSVPQNRERVFIVGHLRGTSRPEVFPIGESCGKPADKTDKQGCSNTLTERSAGGQNRRGNYIKINKKGVPKKEQMIAATLTGGAHSGGNHSDIDLLLQDAAIRRLTPKECERLQGFPDGWTEGVSDTQRYKCLGNAVTVNVVEHIISNISNF